MFSSSLSGRCEESGSNHALDAWAGRRTTHDEGRVRTLLPPPAFKSMVEKEGSGLCESDPDDAVVGDADPGPMLREGSVLTSLAALVAGEGERPADEGSETLLDEA